MGAGAFPSPASSVFLSAVGFPSYPQFTAWTQHQQFSCRTLLGPRQGRGGAPTGGNPAGPRSARPDRPLRPPSPGGAQTAQSGCAPSAPTSGTSRPAPQSRAWTLLRGPAATCARAAPLGAAFGRPAAALPTPAVRRHVPGFHRGASAYTPRDELFSPHYTAKELVRHGTRAVCDVANRFGTGTMNPSVGFPDFFVVSHASISASSTAWYREVFTFSVWIAHA